MRAPGHGDFRIERVHGQGSVPYLEALAHLRIEVFREYPYLYEGSMENERQYMQDYARSPRSTLVVARVDDELVGVATACPLLDHGDGEELAKPFRTHGYDPTEVYYFGESVLRKSYRGRGIGHAFFDEREAGAREQGFRIAAFCAVDRGPTHPARPADYVPHDAFWTRRGFAKRLDMVVRFSWRDVGDHDVSEKPMVFWLEELSP